jgi:hypothetical protein
MFDPLTFNALERLPEDMVDGLFVPQERRDELSSPG